MSDLQDMAQEMYDSLVTKTRNDGTTYIGLKDGAPGWMQDAIREAHLGEMPNDWIYDKIDTILENALYYESEDDMFDAVYEIEPDVYTADLLNWVAENIGRMEYLDRALENGPRDSFQMLAMAQQTHIEEIGQTLISELSSLAEAYDRKE